MQQVTCVKIGMWHLDVNCRCVSNVGTLIGGGGRNFMSRVYKHDNVNAACFLNEIWRVVNQILFHYGNLFINWGRKPLR